MSDDDDRIARLEKENEELRARVSALEPKPEFKVEYQGPKDWTEGMTMPRSAVEAMVRAVGPGVMAGIVNDARRRMEPSSIIPKEGPKEEPKARGTGWQPERPLEMPPGQDHIERMMNAEDVVWRRELAKKLKGE